MSAAPASGRLLVAAPSLHDANFSRTVVLLCRYSSEAGAFGLILNRAGKLPLRKALPDLSKGREERLWRGGPVETETLWMLHRLQALEQVSEPVMDGLWFAGGAAFTKRLVEAAGPDVDGDVYRCYAGFAGWGTGQLEAEIREGSWAVVACGSQAPFGTDDDLWAEMSIRSLLPGGTNANFIDLARLN
ncbi:MAG: YqgE/AlgH family protein [Planctomycetes bacterium]|nr:YqgE/AlgH family protein [Planctomycetota bacterium]